ncbi:phosphopantetheine-binding protein [Streptomyces sp. YH02]|uniref:phosphopantetheine-binding protein n=1 Tax=Streptomyces sp. YH02 TaxID=3256999 RepID=UPI003757E50D
MSLMTFDDLKKILAECAGEDETTGLAADALDTPFTDLGYDSLALLEAAALAGQRFGAELTDEEVTSIVTPREFLDRVNVVAPTAA